MATFKDARKKAVVDLLEHFSRVSAQEGIGPCTLAVVVSEFAKTEEWGTSYLRQILSAAGDRSEKVFLDERAEQDKLIAKMDAAAGR